MTPTLPRDIRSFLDGYPGDEDDPSRNANLEFYTNQRRCEPDHLFLKEIHQKQVLQALSPRVV